MWEFSRWGAHRQVGPAKVLGRKTSGFRRERWWVRGEGVQREKVLGHDAMRGLEIRD